MSLGILVGRFGTFLEEQARAPEAVPAQTEFPQELNHLREAVGHHLVALTLCARCDGEFADAERAVIVRHCLDQAKKGGMALSADAGTMLDEYLRTYTPVRMQLASALKRLEHDSAEDLLALVAAAQAVIEADGVVRPSERKFIGELEADLKAL